MDIYIYDLTLLFLVNYKKCPSFLLFLHLFLRFDSWGHVLLPSAEVPLAIAPADRLVVKVGLYSFLSSFLQVALLCDRSVDPAVRKKEGRNSQRMDINSVDLTFIFFLEG